MNGNPKAQQDEYRVIKPGRVLLDHGPMTIVIEAFRKGQPLTSAALAGVERAYQLLEELVEYLPTARMAVGDLPSSLDLTYPAVLRRMVRAVRHLDEPEFTPMAAVAGTFAEMIQETVLTAGADRVGINNGGDISLARGEQESPFRIGIVQDLADGKVTHVINLNPDENIGGVATSGFGGRSLTKGVASAVTVLAKEASLADAAATAVANATNCDSAAVVRCLAQELDYQTDIYNHLVTRKIGILTPQEIEIALNNGLRRAQALIDKGMIQGTVIFVQRKSLVYPLDLVKPLVRS